MQIGEQFLALAVDDPKARIYKYITKVPNQTKMWKRLRENQLYPCHIQRIQALRPEDQPHRVQLCECLLHQYANVSQKNKRLASIFCKSVFFYGSYKFNF